MWPRFLVFARSCRSLYYPARLLSGRGSATQHRFEYAPDVFEHPRFTGRPGMQSVPLHHLWLQGYPLKQERNERHMIFAREIKVDPVKPVGVSLAVIGRQVHADQQHARSVMKSHGDHGRKIGVYLCQRESTQTIICPKLDDHDPRTVTRQRRG